MPSDHPSMLDEIKAAILSGRWAPGEKLQPMSLAAQFGTSTTVVREALTRLAGDELVKIERNRGFFVRELNLRELKDITELRCVTEALAARLSVERGDVRWESELIAAHHQLTRTPRRMEGDTTRINEAWSIAHRNFHAKLLDACACPPMINLAANLSDFTELYRHWAAPSKAAVVRNAEQEHQDLLQAALSHDAEKLGRLLREHYEATVRVVLESGLTHDAADPAPAH